MMARSPVRRVCVATRWALSEGDPSPVGAAVVREAECTGDLARTSIKVKAQSHLEQKSGQLGQHVSYPGQKSV